VTGSPITSAGTLNATLVSQTANTVFAAPNGSAGAPSFRVLAAADLPYRLYSESISSPVAQVATGTNTQAFGSGAQATLSGEKAFASGVFAAAGDAQAGMYIARNITSAAGATPLFLDGTSAQLVVTNNSVWTFDVKVAGRRTDAVGGGAGYRIFGVLRKDATNGSIVFVGTPSKQVLGETTASLDCNVAVDTATGALVVNVSGLAGQTWRWVAVIQTTEVAQ
jgi:hypothetical protein